MCVVLTPPCFYVFKNNGRFHVCTVVYDCVYVFSTPTPPPPPAPPQESPTLVDDEAVLGEIVPGEYPLISPQHEQNFGRVLSDVVHPRFVSQIKGRHLTGHLKKDKDEL